MAMVDQIARLMQRAALALVQRPRILLYRCLSTNTIHGSARCYQPVQCVGLGHIRAGEGVSFGVFPSPFFLSTYAYLEARHASASISIGEATWFNNNFCAIAEHTSIEIGRNCLFGANVEISDSDFHGVKVDERKLSRPEWDRPVKIGDDVFVGSNVKIMKGITIGNGAVVANGSLVSKDIPANMIAAGNPARVIRATAVNE